MKIGPTRLELGDLTEWVQVGVVVALVAIFYEAVEFPGSLASEAWFPFVATSGALLAFGLLSHAVRKRSPEAYRVPLRIGAAGGLWLGAWAVFSHSLEVFASLNPLLGTVIGVSGWAMMFIVFAAIGSATYPIGQSLRMVFVAGLWGAIVNAVIISAFGHLVSVLFMSRMQDLLLGPCLQSGQVGLSACVVRNTLESGLTHLGLLPIVGMVFASLGAAATWTLRWVPQRTMPIVAGLAILMLITGLAAIGFASTFARSERPPFIMVGLGLLGMTLPSLSAFWFRRGSDDQALT